MHQHPFFEAANMPRFLGWRHPNFLGICIRLKFKPWLNFILGLSLICLHSMLCYAGRFGRGRQQGCGGILIICPLSAQSTPRLASTFHKLNLCYNYQLNSLLKLSIQTLKYAVHIMAFLIICPLSAQSTPRLWLSTNSVFALDIN